MAHYAKIVDNTVVQVIVAEEEFFKNLIDTTPGIWLKTSYNTKGGEHFNPITMVEDTSEANVALRGNYAGIGYTHDPVHDVFYAPQPFPSWVLNTTTWLWEAPVAMPTDGKIYSWNELQKIWEEVVQSVPPIVTANTTSANTSNTAG